MRHAMPVVLWLVVHAAQAVGWRATRSADGLSVTVTEDRPNMTHKPRRWLVTAQELPP